MSAIHQFVPMLHRDDAERGAPVVVLARDGQSGDRVLERLVRGDPADHEPNGTRSGITAREWMAWYNRWPKDE